METTDTQLVAILGEILVILQQINLNLITLNANTPRKL